MEDDPDNLQAMHTMLQGSCGISEAYDGRAAVEQARPPMPDLILMDTTMPVMEGFAALAAIREVAVAVTASAMLGDRAEIPANGFDGHVSKSADRELLKHTMNEVLNGNR